MDCLRIEHNKVVQIVKLFNEGLGVRAVSRFTGCYTHTVLNTLEMLAPKFDLLHDKLVRNLTVGSLQIDELWARVGCSQKNSGGAKNIGDQYTFLALTAREKLIISYHTGKRNHANTDAFVSDFSKRIVGRVQITSDSWRSYPWLVRHYLLSRLDYAVMQKLFDKPKDYVDSARVYSPPTCTGFTISVKAGVPDQSKISTSFVERANLTVRHFNKFFVRLGLGYSRKLENHRAAISLFVATYNFCKVHSTLGCTPAVGAKLTNHNWKIEELIDSATNC